MRALTTSMLLFTFFALTQPVSAQHSKVLPQITEWQVPWPDSRPRDPYIGGPDLIWFVGQTGDYVASFTPSTAQFKRYPLPAGTGPHNVIADQRGVWYAGNRTGHIGLLSAATGNISQFPLPGSGRRDVHTMAFTSGGDIWFSVQQGNQIGIMDSNSQTITLFDTATANARPYGLVVFNDQPWVAYFGSNKLATFQQGKLTEIVLPRQHTLPRRLTVTADGNVWYVDYAGGYLGRYNPQTTEVKEWRTPGAEKSMPYAMASDKNGMLWFVETGVRPNRLVGFSPATEQFTSPVAIESGGGSVRHMVYDPLDHSLWFGTDTNTLAQAKL
jgi:virginiamycin B lyase